MKDCAFSLSDLRSAAITLGGLDVGLRFELIVSASRGLISVLSSDHASRSAHILRPRIAINRHGVYQETGRKGGLALPNRHRKNLAVLPLLQ
jgi:hypothetical protein